MNEKGKPIWSDWYDWREQIDQQLLELASRLSEMERKSESLCDLIESNTGITEQVKTDTAELVEWIRNSKGAFRVLGALGSVAKWAGGIAMAVAAIMALWHDWTGK